MKEIVFTIDYTEVLKVVQLRTYYLGEELKNSGQPVIGADVQVCEDNYDVLNGYIRQAQGRIADLLPGKTKVEPDNDSLCITVAFPDTFDVCQQSGIQQSILELAACYTLHRWTSSSLPDRAAYYLDLANAAAADIKHRVNCRTEPTKRPRWPQW